MPAAGPSAWGMDAARAVTPAPSAPAAAGAASVAVAALAGLSARRASIATTASISRASPPNAGFWKVCTRSHAVGASSASSIASGFSNRRSA